jgi:hypothetical protein
MVLLLNKKYRQKAGALKNRIGSLEIFYGEGRSLLLRRASAFCPWNPAAFIDNGDVLRSTSLFILELNASGNIEYSIRIMRA